MNSLAKTSDQITKIADEIEKVLQENDMPAANQTAINRLRFLAQELHGVDNYTAEKAHKIARHAEQFYSTRKHENYRGGADQLYTDMKFDLLRRIRGQAENRQAVND